MAVELADSLVQFHALLALDEKLGDLLASLDVLQADFPHLALLRRSPFRFRMQRSERVRGELALVLIERDLGLGVPDLALLVREVLPGESDDLRQRAVVRLDVGGDVLVFDEGGSEEDECVRRTGDVVLRLLLRVARGGTTAGKRIIAGREEGGLEIAVDRAGRIVERPGSDVRGEGDHLHARNVSDRRRPGRLDVWATFLSGDTVRPRSAILNLPGPGGLFLESRTRAAGMAGG